VAARSTTPKVLVVAVVMVVAAVHKNLARLDNSCPTARYLFMLHVSACETDHHRMALAITVINRTAK